MNDWLTTLHEYLVSGMAVVRVTVATVHGSSPRNVGTTMLVGESHIDGTIGGGHLEWQAIAIARTLLSQPESPVARLERFALGEKLGQCCGGTVELWFERYDDSVRDFVADILSRRSPDALLLTTLGPAITHRLISIQAPPDDVLVPSDIATTNVAVRHTGDKDRVLIERIDPPRDELYLFGAGHVGKALVHVLADLPLHITWIDSRVEMFPATLPTNVRACCTDDPLAALPEAPADAWFIVLTHSHQLDYAICQAILTRGAFSWLGLIGSRTKAARFVQRLKRQGIGAERLARLTCPIGLAGISSKLPAAIAVSTAAQLIGLTEQRKAGMTDLRPLTPQAQNS